MDLILSTLELIIKILGVITALLLLIVAILKLRKAITERHGRSKRSDFLDRFLDKMITMAGKILEKLLLSATDNKKDLDGK